MDSSDSRLSREYVPIPEVLFSRDTRKQFSNCLVCNKYLLDDGTIYLIEKAVKHYPEMKLTEVIFEYAMCLECSTEMNSALSEESRARINEYFATKVNLAERTEALMKDEVLNIENWISDCVVKNTPIGESQEYQIVAQCDGSRMVFGYMPFVLSMEAMEELTSLLSAKSRGEIDDFMGKYFTGPPEVSEILKRRFVLI